MGWVVLKIKHDKKVKFSKEFLYRTNLALHKISDDKKLFQAEYFVTSFAKLNSAQLKLQLQLELSLALPSNLPTTHPPTHPPVKVETTPKVNSKTST